MKFPILHRVLLALALAVFFSGCSRDPNVRKQKHFRSGQQYFQQAKYKEAAIEFFNAVQIDPDYAEAHYQLAQSYLKVQQWNPAYQELARTVELQPENYQARLDMADLAIAARDFKRAQEQTDWLLQKRPDDPQVHVTISSLFAGQGTFPTAVQEMQKAVALAPGRSDFYLNLALLQVKNSQPDAAEASFKKAIELDPKAPDASFFLANYYQSRGNLSDAEQQFRNAIAADPRNPEFRGALARLYLAEGRKSQAEEYLRQASREFPDNPLGYRMLGDFYYATGDADKATWEYAAILREHPKDLQAKKNYIQLLIQKARVDEAQVLDDEILQNNPQDSDALVYRGQIQMQQNHLSDANSTLATAVKIDSGNAFAHYYLGVALEKLGNGTSAENEWRQAAQLRPDLIDAQRALAGVAMRKGDMSALERAASQIISQQPTSPDGYALRAISDINRKLFGAAEQDAHQAIEVAPQSPLGYVQLGNLNFVQKQYGPAGRAYQDALDRDANSVDALRGLMNTLLAQNQADKAIAIVHDQIAKSPDNSGFYDLLGTTLATNKKDWNSAEAAFRKSADLDKDNSDALMKLGEVLAEQGHTDEAIAIYQQAVKDHPREASFYILMGELYEAKQDWKKAQDAYQSALEIKPNDPLASNNLANVMLQTGGNVDVAFSLAQTARREMPDSAEVADTLGWVYYQKGAYQSAISLLQEAVKLGDKNKAPDNPGFHYHLGLAYAKVGQSSLARQELERVLKINPNYSDAAEVKKQLAQLKS